MKRISILLFWIFAAVMVKAQEKDLSMIAFRMAQANRFESKHIGFAGSLSPQYQLFEQLKLNGDSTGLSNLVYSHPNNVVKLYAAKAFIQKKYILPATMEKYMLGIKEYVSTMNGCVIMKQPVATLFETMID